jgi:hypothetical protein
MAITYTWTVEQMNCAVSEDGHSDVVNVVHWILTGSDENNNAGSVYGSVGVTYNPDDSFIDYNNLTEADVLAWVWDSSENFKTDQEAIVAAQIENEANPTEVTLPLPWATA